MAFSNIGYGIEQVHRERVEYEMALRQRQHDAERMLMLQQPVIPPVLVSGKDITMQGKQPVRRVRLLLCAP